MRAADFELLLGLLSRLSVEQKGRLRSALAGSDGEAALVALLETRLGERPVCVHCGGERVQRWGFSHGLRRFRCRGCARSFNALTGTALARLRRKGVWLAFADCLSEGLTVAQAAERCGVAISTSFRWRHRFLQVSLADSEPLSGIVEADETFFRLSYKGSRRWRTSYPQAHPRAPARPPKKRGTPARTGGLSVEQVPVLVARDRAGASRAMVLNDRSGDALDAAIGEALPADAVLVSDGWRGFARMAERRGIRHEALATGQRVRETTWHIQNANAQHSRLKAWVASRNGVATRYLPNYLAWHHGLEREGKSLTAENWIRWALQTPPTANAN